MTGRKVWVLHSYFWDASTIEGVYDTLQGAQARADELSPGPQRSGYGWHGGMCKVTEMRTYAIEEFEVSSGPTVTLLDIP